MSNTPDIYVAASLDEAVDALADRGGEGAVLAGGTWIMRAPLRDEAFRPSYVALSKIATLKRVEIGEAAVEIGAGVTHAELAETLAGLAGLEALCTAAGTSANPAVRSMATVGGNLAAADFAAADLVPALLALGAQVEIAATGGSQRLDLDAFLTQRAEPQAGRLISGIVVPRSAARSAHARLPLRKAGDYPVALVSVSATLGASDRIAAIRIAVGSVEGVARRWAGLESALIGRRLDPDAIADLAGAHLADFTGRDGVEAPGWYRVSVLPTLVRRAVHSLIAAA